tara:strand:- start:384 stop:665 length:282 start_codon:yes stop_codon:yes gene_type:complete
MIEEDSKDLVNFPPHYKQGGVECIDAIKSCLGNEFSSYLQGNAIKYLWRYEHKGKPIQDLEKAKWFIEKLIAFVQEKQNANNKKHRDLTEITV